MGNDRERQRLAAAHGRAAFFMGDTGRQGALSRFWRRAWTAAATVESEGREAARSPAARDARHESMAIYRLLGEAQR